MLGRIAVNAFNWCFPAVRLCKKHGRESRVMRIIKTKKNMEKEITFKAIPVKDRNPEQFGSIHFVLLDGRLQIMAQYNPQGWCYLSGIPAKEPPKVICGNGVSHWLEQT